ncbi:MAG: hypothetical protein WA947_10395 [Phormidesmis sp.]
MSTSVLPQLMEVDSELSAQVTELESRITELQEKRKGIQTVIAMFESGSAPDITDIAAVTGASEKSDKATKKATAKKTTAKKTATKTTARAVGKTAKAKRGRPAKAKVAKAADTTKPDSATETAKAEQQEASKRSGRTANWQRYVQENYRKEALPDVIGGVLQAQPGTVFKIADVMNEVFKEDMPKNHFLKARNRVSNILSAGAREGSWYRGRGGTYSVSEKAVKAS